MLITLPNLSEKPISMVVAEQLAVVGKRSVLHSWAIARSKQSRSYLRDRIILCLTSLHDPAVRLRPYDALHKSLFRAGTKKRRRNNNACSLFSSPVFSCRDRRYRSFRFGEDFLTTESMRLRNKPSPPAVFYVLFFAFSLPSCSRGSGGCRSAPIAL